MVQRCHGCLTSLTRRVLATYFEESRRRAEDAGARSAELLASIGHELRNRLQLVGLTADALRAGRHGEAGDRDRLFQQLERTLFQLDALANDVARVQDNGAAALPARRAELSALVGGILEQIRLAADDAGVRLLLPQLAPACDVDAGRLELVLFNLLSTAIKYRDPAKIDPWVRVEVIDEDAGYRIEISDNGVGLESEHIDRSFDRSYRVEPQREAGEGLGLYLARRALQQLGSSLTVESERGRGTVFSFTLMLAEDDWY